MVDHFVEDANEVTGSEPKKATACYAIKFSHDYYKLPFNWDGTKARLINLTKINLENQTEQLIEYDTQIRDPPGEGYGTNYYPLPESGEFMLLLFMHESGAIFTTLRRYTPTKHAYYADAIGEQFTLTWVLE